MSLKGFFIPSVLEFHVFLFPDVPWQHAYSPESDGESRHKKHRRDHRDSRRHDELEDGELGEDGEIQ